MPRLHRTVYKNDKNFKEAIRALKDRCGGYWKDKEFPHHYAHCNGLRVALYDTNKMGQGFPDAELWVSWLCIQIEVKQERPDPEKRGKAGRHKDAIPDDEYYRKQLENTEIFYRLHHTSIVPIVWDRNQIYELIKAMADFVLFIEGRAEGNPSFIKIFFPKLAQQTYNKD